MLTNYNNLTFIMFLNLINPSPTFDHVNNNNNDRPINSMHLQKVYKTRFKHTTKLLTRKKLSTRVDYFYVKIVLCYIIYNNILESAMINQLIFKTILNKTRSQPQTNLIFLILSSTLSFSVYTKICSGKFTYKSKNDFFVQATIKVL